MLLALLLGCTSPPEGPSVSLLTYNVNFEKFDPSSIDAIAHADADLVFLQETTAEWETALRADLSDRYPFIEFHAHDPDGGQAVLSKAPFQTHSRQDSPVRAFPVWWLTADTALGTLSFVHVHLHPPLDEGGLLTGYFTTTEKRATEVQAYLTQGFSEPADVWIGDFNEETGDAVNLLLANDYRDAAVELGKPKSTWHMDHWSQLLNGRPDHVFHHPEWQAVSTEVYLAGGSDHRPLRVDLQRRPAK